MPLVDVGSGYWQKLAASIDWRQQECTKNAPVWATVDVEAVFKSDLGIPQYPPLVLLQLDVLPFYELIIKSPAALQQYGHLPRVAVSFLGRHALQRRLGGLPFRGEACRVG